MSDAEQIVQAILEADEFDDFKDALIPDENGYWEQIDGDYGDPWVYGGTWLNRVKREILHFDGVENEKEIDPDDVEVPPHTLEKIKRMVHDPDLDQDWAREDPAWLEKQLKQEEWEVERKVGEYQYAKAAFLNARKPYQFEIYRFDGDMTELPPELADKADDVRGQFEPGEFDSWPAFSQLVEILRYWGWHRYADEIVMMSKKEAQVYLGMSL